MKSFEINHEELIPGVYLHAKSGLVTTWDVRIKRPNKGDYLTPPVIHTIEHTLATYMRERFGNYRIVGIFPMGCQTGFYVLTRGIDSIKIMEAVVDYIMALQRTGSIPGSRPEQCGQYKLHDLQGAKQTMRQFYEDYLKFHHKASRY